MNKNNDAITQRHGLGSKSATTYNFGTNNSVFNLPLKISQVADVLTCSDSTFHTMGVKNIKQIEQFSAYKGVH